MNIPEDGASTALLALFAETIERANYVKPTVIASANLATAPVQSECRATSLMPVQFRQPALDTKFNFQEYAQ